VRAQDLARRGDHCGCWRELKALLPRAEPTRSSGPQKLITAANKTLLLPEEQAAHLLEHFQEVYNSGTGADEAAVAALPQPRSVRDCPPPTAEEVLAALGRLRNGKARAPNGLSNEHLKYAGVGFIVALRAVALTTWEEGLPPSCKVTGLLPLPKKGDTTRRNNYRGIQIADKLYLLVARMAATRLDEMGETFLGDFQAGFRRERSCRDQRFILQLLLEGAAVWRRPVYLAFVDLEKAFDRVDRDALLAMLVSCGAGEALVRVVRDLHSSTTARLRWRGVVSEAFEILWGLQQGSPPSNPLWNVVADIIGKQTLATLQDLGYDAGVRVLLSPGAHSLHMPAAIPVDAEELRLLLMLLADDATLCTETPESLATALRTLAEVAGRWGMKINAAKTKIMIAGPGVIPEISLDGSPLEVVQEVKYLGSMFTQDGSLDREIDARIGRAHGAVRQLRKIWNCRKASLGFKMVTYKTLVKTILLYGGESWPLTQSQTAKLEAFHQRQLRSILRIRWDALVSNSEVLRRAGDLSIADTLRLLRLKWLGHTFRLDDGRMLRRMLFGRLDGRRARGQGCRKTMQRTLLNDIAWLQGGFTDGLPWHRRAADRELWRVFIHSKMGIVQGAAAQGAAAAGPAPTPVAAAPGPQNAAPVAEEAVGQVLEAADAMLDAAAPGDEAGPSNVRQSGRVTERLGLALPGPLSPLLATASGQPRKALEQPLVEWRRGAPPGSGRRQRGAVFSEKMKAGRERAAAARQAAEPARVTEPFLPAGLLICAAFMCVLLLSFILSVWLVPLRSRSAPFMFWR
jgi:hypothetical protein